MFSFGFWLGGARRCRKGLLAERRKKNSRAETPATVRAISRTDRIYGRIEDLEREYLSLLRNEFVADSVGLWSPYLNDPTVRRQES